MSEVEKGINQSSFLKFIDQIKVYILEGYGTFSPKAGSPKGRFAENLGQSYHNAGRNFRAKRPEMIGKEL